jgi:hypothetical protein
LAAKLAISFVSSLLLNYFILEGDSSVVIQSLNHPHSDIDWRISPILMDFLSSIPSTSSWEARKINRSANFCTHSMARWAVDRSYSGSIPFSSLYFPLPPIYSGTNPPPSFIFFVVWFVGWHLPTFLYNLHMHRNSIFFLIFFVIFQILYSPANVTICAHELDLSYVKSTCVIQDGH